MTGLKAAANRKDGEARQALTGKATDEYREAMRRAHKLADNLQGVGTFLRARRSLTKGRRVARWTDAEGKAHTASLSKGKMDKPGSD